MNIHCFTEEIAAYMYGWTYRADLSRFALGVLTRDADGLQVDVYETKVRGVPRLVIALAFRSKAWEDSDRDFHQPRISGEWPKITVDPSSSPAKCAKHILGRLVPVCEEPHVQGVRLRRQCQKYLDGIKARAEEFGLVYEPGTRRYEKRLLGKDDLDVRIRTALAQYEMQLHGVSAEQVREILKILQPLT